MFAFNRGRDDPDEPSLPIEYYPGSCYEPHWGTVELEYPACLYRASGWVGDQSKPQIHVERQRITGYTPCGVWILTAAGKKKYVNLRAEKQWASAHVQEAIDQLQYRKRKQVRILEHQLDMAKEVLDAMEKAFPKKARTYSPSRYDYFDNY